MLTEEQALDHIKTQMTEEQRQEMADVLSAELSRREKMKQKATPSMKSSVPNSSLSGSLGVEDLGDVYSSIDQKVKDMRVRRLE